MTSTNNTPQDVSKLAAQLDGTNEQRAKGIADFVDGRISAAIDGLRSEVSELVGRQKANIAEAKDSGSPEVKAQTNEATSAVKAADQAVDKADKSGSQQDVSRADEAVKGAKEKVDKTESDLAARVSTVEEQGADHEKRICALEENQTGLIASVEGLLVTVRAHAKSIATGNGAITGLRRAGQMALGAFVLVVALWLLLVLTPWATLLGSWNIGIGLAAVVGGLAFAYTVMTMEKDVPASASAEADAGVNITQSPAR